LGGISRPCAPKRNTGNRGAKSEKPFKLYRLPHLWKEGGGKLGNRTLFLLRTVSGKESPKDCDPRSGLIDRKTSKAVSGAGTTTGEEEKSERGRGGGVYSNITSKKRAKSPWKTAGPKKGHSPLVSSQKRERHIGRVKLKPDSACDPSTGEHTGPKKRTQGAAVISDGMETRATGGRSNCDGGAGND